MSMVNIVLIFSVIAVCIFLDILSYYSDLFGYYISVFLPGDNLKIFESSAFGLVAL